MELLFLYKSFMEYLLLSLIIAVAIVSYLSHRRDMKLLCSVSSPTRGTKAERKLIIKMLKKGVHPKAIFHDLYVKKKKRELLSNRPCGGYSTGIGGDRSKGL